MSTHGRLSRQHLFRSNHMTGATPPLFESLEPRFLLSGTSYIVNSLTDVVASDGVVTLREAIEAANTNLAVNEAPAGSATETDIITFDQAALEVEAGSGNPLTITLDGTQLEITDDLDIQGLGEDVLTVVAATYWRVLYVLGEETDVEVAGLTITGGFSNVYGGGGIYNDDGMLTLVNVTLSGNAAFDCAGGGIYNDSGTLTLMNVTVSSNTASGIEFDIGYVGGGGIYNYRGTVTLTNSAVSGNSVTSYSSATGGYFPGGGGVYNDCGTVTLANSTVSDNSVTSYSSATGMSFPGGGGVYNSEGTVTLTDSIVSGNTAEYDGGGIYNAFLGTVTLTNSVVSGNSATGTYPYSTGGGIYNDGILTLANSTVSGNSAEGYGGGGIHNASGSLTLTNSTVSGNSAYWGGGIRNSYGRLTLTNSTVSGNSAEGYGGGIYHVEGTVTLNNTIVALNDAPTSTDIDIFGRFTSHSSLVSVDPEFVRNPSAGADGVWGTPDDDYGDLRLTDASLAIDLGDDALAVDGDALPLTTDMDGSPRIVHGQVDIGAYEYQGAPSGLRESPSSVVTTLADVVDTTDGEISLHEACVYGGILEQDVTFAPGLSGGTIILCGSELYIYQSLTIDATSIGGLTIDADDQSRVMSIAGRAEVSLTGLTITGGHTTVHGGGIYNYLGNLTLTNSMVSGNTAGGGGGIYNSRGTVTLTNSTVSGNSADGGGGGIYNYRGTVTLTNSTVSGNLAAGAGGICNGIYGTVTLTNSVVSGNSATGTYSDSGGIYNSTSGTVTLTNSTVSGNSADRRGGGICNYGTVTLNNTIVALNDAPTNADIRGTYTNNSSMVGGDPDFVRDPYAGADGVWGTADDDYGDLRLLPTSSAIDAGNNALLPADEFDLDGDSDTLEALPVDLAGNQRIRNLTVDMGAYEYALPGDADDDGKIDGADLAAWQRNYDPVGVNDNTFEMGDFDGNGKVDGADLAIWQRNYDPVGSGAVGLESVADASPVGGLALEPIAGEASEALSIATQQARSAEPVVPNAALGVSVIDDQVSAGRQSAMATIRARVRKQLKWRDDGLMDVLALAGCFCH